MCGRATLITSNEDIAEIFGVAPTLPDGPPRFNIAPGQDLVVVQPSSQKKEGKELAVKRWGMIPHWASDPKIAYRCINARSETIAGAPAFRDAFRSRRCLVVVDGFYEWQDKMARHIRLPDRKPFALAGVWDRWTTPDGEVLETCAVVTTPSFGSIVDLHDRMPLVLAGRDRDLWLGGVEDARAVVAHAKATQAERAKELEIVPVGKRVNDVKNDDPACLAPPSQADAPAPSKQTSLF